MKIFRKASQILGMNARNFLFTSTNNAQQKRFADDKLFTKQFLESRNIGVAKLYRTIKSHQDLREFDPDTLPQSFVIKPNRGFGGEGIIPIIKKSGKKFLTAGGKKLSFEEIFVQCEAILSGQYSISGVSDIVLIEEFLSTHPDLLDIAPLGLPDFRIIVYNHVPIIGMMRVPTPESDGKANVHIGGIGVGIDMGTGKTTFGVQYNDPCFRFSTGQVVKNFQIPYWDQMLIDAARIQKVTGIPFLGVDFTISPTGVKVLEVNARAGLAIQIANRVPLRTRLDKVRDLKIPSPEKGVEVAKALFSQRSHKAIQKIKTAENTKIIGAFEYVLLYGEKNREILAKIDPHATQNLISGDCVNQEGGIFTFSLSKNRLQLPFSIVENLEGDEDMIIAGKYLSDFTLDFSKKLPPKVEKRIALSDEKLLKNIDEKICEIDSAIKLLSFFKPLNLKEEKEQFLKNKNQSPQFIYKEPKESFDSLRKKLSKIPRQCDHPLFPLFENKIKEIEEKIRLIEGRDTPQMQHSSEKIWGGVSSDTYRRAIMFRKNLEMQEDNSPLLSFKQVVEYTNEFLKQQKLRNWSVAVLENTVSDFQISKKNMLLVKKGVTVTENRLRSTLAHEIEVHGYRLENGRKSPYLLFERGTAGYLKTEEGLAIFTQKRVGVPLGEKVLWEVDRTIGAYMAKQMSFVDLFHFLQDTFDVDDEAAWKTCLKSKRGLRNTSRRLAFTKDTVYFCGREEVEKFFEKEGLLGLRRLFAGKITIQDLQVLQHDLLWETLYFPGYVLD